MKTFKQYFNENTEVESSPKALQMALDNKDWKLASKIANMAAYTQRAQPESVMFKITHAIQDIGAPELLTHLLEHIGDLSHRAQEKDGIAIANVHEKIKKIENTMRDGSMSLEEDMEYGWRLNAEYKIVRGIPELRDMEDAVGTPEGPKRRFEVYELARKKYAKEIESIIEENKIKVQPYLNEYVNAHKEYNKPVTYLGVLGKQAAIATGELNFDRLRYIVKKIRDWLNKYSGADEEEKRKMFYTVFEGN